MAAASRSLISILAGRKTYKIRKEKHILHAKDWSFRTDQYHIISIHERPDLHENITQYMLSTFYREAPIPLALKLTNDHGKRTHDYLINEIECSLNSGCSLIYVRPETNDILGITLNLVWNRNVEYNVIGASTKTWHNAAAEVVHNDPEIIDKHLAWRNYQYQHIYDLGQNLLQRNPKKKYVLYLNTGYINPEMRLKGSSGIRTINQLDEYQRHWDLTDCIVYFATTFSKGSLHIQNHYKNYEAFDYAGYDEEELILDGKKCFEPLRKLGGITFYVDFLTNFEYKTKGNIG